MVVCLTATPEALAARLATDHTRPLLAAPEGPEARIRSLLAARREAYAAIPFQIDTTGKTPAAVADEVITQWENRPPAN